MAFNPQFKINQMAKDMGLKSKELTDLLADKGVGEVKSQKTLTEQEFNVPFAYLSLPSCFLISLRRILPEMVFGNSSTNSTTRGYL